ncbi:cyclic lactone autoinducer peptide [Pelotomaculum isophthalicicum JI]|uniref:Cyclic lactone autoinducer peptide n=1 Tax=Pelotomaculum isophthalicicum JI TaxID=947010 RepID=A0A9X4H4S0_9FIRM|nr:cyclic lactone autoinducer peptide [Pelotomaculum isophthalicicum]MDF9407802.1 cyclic lactone autoinducer peptide [Pelotomaculum isophthalicicum JI]
MKKYIFSLITVLSLIAFFVGFHPTSIGMGFQPELPDELK